MRWVASFLAVLLLGLASPAAACSPPVALPGMPLPPPPPNTDWTLEDPFVLTAISVGVADLGFAIAAGVLGSRRQLFSEEAAVVELVWGALHAAAAGVVGFSGLIMSGNSCSDGFRPFMFFGAAGSLMTMGGWFLGHAIWSLRAEAQPLWQPTVSIWHEGGMIGVRGVY